MLSQSLPTLDRIQRFIKANGQQCYLCDQGVESLHHLILQCPLIKHIWWNSPWKIKVELFSNMPTDEWIALILDAYNDLPLNETEKSKLLQFFVSSFERIWMERNNIWKGGTKTYWNVISSQINR